MTNPYTVLGVDPSATDDEVKKAYRELAKKYHPDNYADSPLADLAQEKMKEINEAYDTIQRERDEKRSHSSYGYSGYSAFSEIRSYISKGDFYEANIRLDSVKQSERNAEWFYLKGIVNESKGFFFEALRCFETACAMEPQNPEYREALNRIQRNANGFDNKRQGGTTVGTCSVCDICAGFMCLDCCCDCLIGPGC